MALPALSIRDELLALQHQLYQKIKHDISDYEGKPSKSFLNYQKCYLQELNNYDRISDKNELIRRVHASDVIFCGDYHTLRQSQRTALRILREAVASGRSIILCLEMLESKHQPLIDHFLADRMNEDSFLKQIDYANSWNFEWNNYKMLFDFCKKYKIKIVGLNCPPKRGQFPLRHRDKHAAGILSSLYEDNPKSLLFCFYGDLHVCSQHIPALFHKQTKRLNRRLKPKSLVIHQNSETLYWVLTHRGLEVQADVVKIDDDIFCIMNTPPWVKLQSYLNWLEKRQTFWDAADPEYSEYDEEHDFHERLWDLTTTILNFFELPAEGMDRFQVYTKGDVAFIDFLNTHMKEKAKTNEDEAEWTRLELIYNGACYLSDQNVLYFNSLNVNKFAEFIVEMIHYQLTQVSIKPPPMNARLDFYFGRILISILSYFGSKIINYKRKCETLADVQATYDSLKGKRLTGRLIDVRETAKLALRHFDLEQRTVETGKVARGFNGLSSQPLRILSSLTRTVAHQIGERLYHAILFDGLPKEEIAKLFAHKISESTDNVSQYFRLIQTLKSVDSTISSKSARF